MKMMKLTAALLCAALVLSSCGSPAASASQSAGQVPANLSAGSGSLAVGTGAAPSTQAAQAVNQLGQKLLGQLTSGEENVFLSPVSVYLALGMVRAGAAGDTAAQLEQALGVAGAQELNALCRDLQLYLTGDRGTTEIHLANSLWLRDSVAPTVQPDFLTSVTDYYGAKVDALNFDDPAAVNTINAWVKENTQGLIEKMIDGDIDPDTILYLINTISFAGKWAVPFDPKATAEAPFHAPGGDVQVQMMHGKPTCPYVEAEEYQAVLLPYEDEKTSLLVLLPKEGTDLAGLVKGGLDVSGLLAAMGEAEVTLSLPKMDVAYDANLNDTLSALGMADMFTDKADLSGITGDKDLQVSEVVHKAVLKVDEEGTEAAASTMVGISRMAAFLPIEMTVDRPFYTAVVDNETGLVLFSGTIVTPQ